MFEELYERFYEWAYFHFPDWLWDRVCRYL